MAKNPRTFQISFVGLLTAVCEKLDLNVPQYTQPDPSTNVVAVKLQKGDGPVGLQFIGAHCDSLSESSEKAAEEAIAYLIKRQKVIIDDVNLTKQRNSTACYEFYKTKREEVECIEQGKLRLSHRDGRKKRSRFINRHPKVVSLDFWTLLKQIIEYYRIPMTSTETIIGGPTNQLCSAAIRTQQPPNKMEFFISDQCDSIAVAMQSLGKKIITHLQPIYGFIVKDANYSKLAYQELHCKLQFESDVAAKERVWGAEDIFQPFLLPSQYLYHTPTNNDNQIPTAQSPPPPPPPKKPKSIWSASASSSRAPPPAVSVPEHHWDAFQANV